MTDDYSKASSEDTPMTIEQMLQNRENWTFAADLILHKQLPRELHGHIAMAFPEFWLTHIVPTGDKRDAH